VSPHNRLEIARTRLDSTSDVPMARQIADLIREQIEDGRLHTGDALPSVRELAAQLRCAAGTVTAAYQLLASAGRLVQRDRRRPTVRGRPPVRTIDANRYRNALGRAREGMVRPELTDFVMAHGIEWPDYTVDATYQVEPANETQAKALALPSGVSVLRRELVEYARGVPVQIRRSVLSLADVH